MEKFFIYAKKADFAAVSQKFNITPMLARIIRNRDIVGNEAIEKFLNGSLKDMYNPFLMKDLRAACDFIYICIRKFICTIIFPITRLFIFF